MTNKMYLTKSSLLRLTAAMALVAATMFTGHSVTRTFATTACPGSLGTSTFQAGSGTMIHISGCTNWDNLGSATLDANASDLTNSASDNSFGVGTKEDSTSPTVVCQKADNKNDLSQLYAAHEVASPDGHIYLYLAFERLASNGSANEDFEFNQKPQTSTAFNKCPGTGGTAQLNRSNGDLLVQFNYGGSGTPTLSLWRWAADTTPLSAGGYFSGGCLQSTDTAPCWSDQEVITPNGTYAVATVNTTSFTDPNTQKLIGPGGFGAAGIDLTSSSIGVFKPGQCGRLGDAWVKGRSSSSASAELKDFISPVPVTVSNCGTIRIHNVTPNGGASDTSSYTTTIATTPTIAMKDFSLSNGQTQTYSNVVSGPAPASYSVTQAFAPSGWTFGSLSSATTGISTSVTSSGATAFIKIYSGGTVDITYTNTQQTSALALLKTASPSTYSTVGDVITYTLLATNQGTASLSGVRISDPMLGASLSCTPAQPVTLAPGASLSCAGSHTITQADLDAGAVVNTAAVTGTPPTGPAVSTTAGAMVTAVQSPALSLTKTASPTSSSTVGDVITYTLLATNTGNVTLSGVNVGDPMLGSSLSCTPAQPTTLAPGASLSCTGSHTITQADLLAGSVTNTAAVTGTPPSGPAVSTTASATVNTIAISTAQIPNASATIKAGTSTVGGTITFYLYSPSNSTCSGTPAYTETVTVNGNGTYSTSNTTALTSLAGNTGITGTWNWEIVYSGDPNTNNAGWTSSCGVETFNIG